jgi:hypothetical protein
MNPSARMESISARARRTLGCACFLAIAWVAGCGSEPQITYSQCAGLCGGDGNVCEFKGGGESQPEGVCVCKDKGGNCPGDAGAQ